MPFSGPWDCLAHVDYLETLPPNQSADVKCTKKVDHVRLLHPTATAGVVTSDL